MKFFWSLWWLWIIILNIKIIYQLYFKSGQDNFSERKTRVNCPIVSYVLASSVPLLQTSLSSSCHSWFSIEHQFPCKTLKTTSHNFNSFTTLTLFYCYCRNFSSMTWAFGIFCLVKLSQLHKLTLDSEIIHSCPHAFCQRWITRNNHPHRGKHMHPLTIPTKSSRLTQGGRRQMNDENRWTAMTVYLLYFKKFIIKWNMTFLGMLMILNKWNDKRKSWKITYANTSPSNCLFPIDSPSRLHM